MACGDVLSLEDLQTAKKHQVFEAEVITGKAGGVATGANIDYATNQVTGQTQKTLPAVLRDAGFRPASFTFASGGTLASGDSDMAVLWPISGGGDGQYYIWKGAYPKVVPAASSPATTGGVSSAGWLPLGDITLRSELASSDGAKKLGTSSGYTQQQINDRVVDARDYGAHPITEPGYSNFDQHPPSWPAIATGRPVRFSGAYKFSAPLTQAVGTDFALVGDDGFNYTAEGNDSASDLSVGATLIWVGGATSAPIIHPTNDIGTGSIVASNFRLIVQPSVSCPFEFDTTRYNNTTGASGAVVRSRNIAVLCTEFNQNPGAQGNSVLRIKADASGDTGFGRFAFGWDISDWYAFNFNQGITLQATNGFINGNHFNNWKMYQVYRPLSASAGEGANSIYQNNFENMQVQPGRLNDGVNPVRFADGLLRYDKNVSGNVFTNLCLYDVDATGVAIVHTNMPTGVSNNLYIGVGDIPGGTQNMHNGLPGWFIRQDGNHKVKSLTLDDTSSTPLGVKVLAKNNTYSFSSVPEGAGTRITVSMDGGVKFSIGPSGRPRFTGISEFANNAAAVSAGLSTGDVYKTGEVLKVVV